MKRMMIIVCLISFFHIQYCMDGGDYFFKQIPVDKLPKYVGRTVRYKEGDTFKKGILGQQVPDNNYSQVYVKEGMGIPVANNAIYRKIRKK